MMKKQFLVTVIAALVLGLQACHAPKATQTGQQNTSNSDNSQTSLDWAGIYAGLLPCADCEGIETQLQVNKDNTYVLKRKYIGKPAEVITNTGTVKWTADGGRINLEGGDGSSYRVGENKLTSLDKDGNVITGDLAAKYVLNKQMNNITEKYWKLTELMGQPVVKTDAMKKEPHIILHNDGNRVAAYGGCNGMGGEYTLKEGNRITFSSMIGTMMACPDMTVEEGLKKVLSTADNYSLASDGNTMTLNKARMAPLAKFEAVYLK